MKKTLAAVAVLGAFAGSALAADVTLYGRLDTGFLFTDSTKSVTGLADVDTSSFEMKSGNSTTSRVGIKGSEEISEGLTVGFVLETKLLGDTGKAFNGGFDRESLVFAKTDFGTVYAGKVGSIWSDGGATNFWAANYSAFGTGSSVGVGTGLMVSQGRVQNRLSYVSPEFAGFKAYAEYSFGSDVDGADEGTSKANRPAAIGLNYANGAFGAGLVVSYTNEASVVEGAVKEQEDEYTVNVGTSYDFGVAKAMLAAQYFKNADEVGSFNDDVFSGTYDELKGYGLTLGAVVPAMGGDFTVGVSYTDGEDAASDLEFSGYNVAGQYSYPLSKRTSVYAGVGYTAVKAETKAVETELESIKAMTGLVHKF